MSYEDYIDTALSDIVSACAPTREQLEAIRVTLRNMSEAIVVDEAKRRRVDEDDDDLFGPELRSLCGCGRAFCGGRALAESVSRRAQDANRAAVKRARAASEAYTLAATAHAEHGDHCQANLVGPGWMGVALSSSVK